MSDWLVRWMQHRPRRGRPRRGIWLAFWSQVLVSACLLSLGVIPYLTLTLMVTLAFAIWFLWRLPDDVDRDDGGRSGEQDPDQRSM